MTNTYEGQTCTVRQKKRCNGVFAPLSFGKHQDMHHGCVDISGKPKGENHFSLASLIIYFFPPLPLFHSPPPPCPCSVSHESHSRTDSGLTPTPQQLRHWHTVSDEREAAASPLRSSPLHQPNERGVSHGNIAFQTCKF